MISRYLSPNAQSPKPQTVVDVSLVLVRSMSLSYFPVSPYYLLDSCRNSYQTPSRARMSRQGLAVHLRATIGRRCRDVQPWYSCRIVGIRPIRYQYSSAGSPTNLDQPYDNSVLGLDRRSLRLRRSRRSHDDHDQDLCVSKLFSQVRW